MTVLELIKKSALILNEKEILEDEKLANVTVNNCEEILENNFALNRMFEILKILLNNIAVDYLPIVKEKTCISANKKISLEEFENLSKIVSVKVDKFPVKYKIANEYINLDFDGVFNVEYNALPVINSLLDDVQVFYKNISYDLLIYGVASLYCLAIGLMDEFEIYNNIYSSKLTAIKSLKLIDMPARRWE